MACPVPNPDIFSSVLQLSSTSVLHCFQRHILMHQLPGKPVLPLQNAVLSVPCQFNLATLNQVTQRMHLHEQHLRGKQSIGPQWPAV